MNDKPGKGAALAMVVTGTLVSGAVFGQVPGSCLEAYLQSGFAEQQLSFDPFRHSYADALCAPDDYQTTA